MGISVQLGQTHPDETAVANRSPEWHAERKGERACKSDQVHWENDTVPVVNGGAAKVSV